MTGMIFIFVSHFTAGNMHCKIKQREEEHCREIANIYSRLDFMHLNQKQWKREALCVSLWYIYSSTIAHKVSFV